MKRFQRTVGAYQLEMYFDFACWMVGINIWPWEIGRGGYLHIGPLIVGYWKSFL